MKTFPDGLFKADLAADGAFIKAGRMGLVKKVITNKLGKRQTVLIRPGQDVPGPGRQAKVGPDELRARAAAAAKPSAEGLAAAKEGTLKVTKNKPTMDKDAFNQAQQAKGGPGKPVAAEGEKPAEGAAPAEFPAKITGKDGKEREPEQVTGEDGRQYQEIEDGQFLPIGKDGKPEAESGGDQGGAAPAAGGGPAAGAAGAAGATAAAAARKKAAVMDKLKDALKHTVKNIVTTLAEAYKGERGAAPEAATETVRGAGQDVSETGRTIRDQEEAKKREREAAAARERAVQAIKDNTAATKRAKQAGEGK